MVTPRPLKLGHLVLRVSNLQRSVEFYREVVGLKVSDYVGKRMAFMRAGTDHHDLALVQMSEDEIACSKKGIPNVEHFAYQLSCWEEIESATAMLLERGVEVTRGPGKHGSGENCFIVFQDPDGHNVEFYSDMLQISEDASYEPSVWADDIDTFDQWRCKKFVVEPAEGIKHKLMQMTKNNN